MEPRLAFMAAALVCVPSMMLLLYRSIVPYEDAMPDFRLAGALFYPAIAGFALGLVHASIDTGLILAGYGPVAYLGLYPAIETYAVVVIFNRNFFFKQPAAPLYFAVGGAALALGIAFVETYRAMASPAFAASDLGALAAMVALASAFVMLHTSKGLLVGTYFAEGRRARGVAGAMALQVPFGAFMLTFRVGVAPLEMAAAMALYAGLVYALVWHRFFPRRMPRALEAELDRVAKQARRRAIARRQK